MSLGTVNEDRGDETSSLTAEQRQRYAELADILIPQAEGMPSASEAEVHTRWLDEALRARPDLVPGVRLTLELSAGVPASEAIELLNSEHTPVFDAFGTITAGAYFLNPDVKERIGYPGQVPQPVVDDVESYLDLLENVVERGAIYRDVPDDAAKSS